MQAHQHTRTHTHQQYTERLAAWELHAVFKQIIKGKVMRSRRGHSWGYSSECVHYCGRKRPRWGTQRPHRGLMRSAEVASNAFSSTHRKAATASMHSHFSVDMCLCAHQRILDTLLPIGLQRQFLLTFCETHTCATTCVCVCADAICISLREPPFHKEALCRVK